LLLSYQHIRYSVVQSADTHDLQITSK